jgi:transposase
MTEDPNTSENVITVKQQKAITALLSERTTREAAKKAGVNEKTLYTWLNEPTFRGALRSAEKDILDDVTRRLSAGQSLALDTLEKLVKSARHESTKLRASVAWLEMSLKFRDMKDIDERLTALEAAINGNKK